MSASDRPTDAGAPPMRDDQAIMAALDDEDLVIADVSCEDAWITVPATEAPELTDWR